MLQPLLAVSRRQTAFSEMKSATNQCSGPRAPPPEGSVSLLLLGYLTCGGLSHEVMTFYLRGAPWKRSSLCMLRLAPRIARLQSRSCGLALERVAGSFFELRADMGAL